MSHFIECATGPDLQSVLVNVARITKVIPAPHRSTMLQLDTGAVVEIKEPYSAFVKRLAALLGTYCVDSPEVSRETLAMQVASMRAAVTTTTTKGN